MTVVVTSKNELVVPKSIRRKAGIKMGDRVEFQVSGRVINIIPKLPYAEDQFTPGARREINQGKFVTLAELEHDLARKPPSRRRKAT